MWDPAFLPLFQLLQDILKDIPEEITTSIVLSLFLEVSVHSQSVLKKDLHQDVVAIEEWGHAILWWRVAQSKKDQ